MLCLRSRWTGLTCLALLAVANPAWADPPPDPLRLIPAQADVVIKIDNPRQLVEGVYELDAFKDLQKIDAIKELLYSTNVKRFNQLVQYFEKKLGVKRYELLDELAGGGVAVGVTIAEKPKGVLVIEGKNEKVTQEFIKTGLAVLEDELSRQAKKKVKLAHKKYQEIDAYELGKEFAMASFGATVVVANDDKVLKACLDMHLNKGGKSILENQYLQQARKMLPEKVLAWGWLNLDAVRKIPETKEFFETPEKITQFNATFFGGFVDVANRSPFLCAGLFQKGSQYVLTVQFPKGIKGMSEKVGGWFPEDGKGTSLPLLEPPNVLYSSSYYMDLAQFWKNRHKVLLPPEAQGLDSLDKDSGKFLGGVKMSELFQLSGKHQRLVVTQPTKSVYPKKKPQVVIPSFALVQEMADVALAKKLDRVIRLGGVFITTQVDLDLVESQHKGVDVVTYQFAEDKGFPGGDPLDIRFGFSPSYAWVGNQFIASSTLELCQNLIEELQKEKNPTLVNAMWQNKFYSSGLASLIKFNEEQLLTQIVLDQGVSLDKAKQQLHLLSEILQTLGTAELETHYSENHLKIDFVLKLGK